MERPKHEQTTGWKGLYKDRTLEGKGYMNLQNKSW